MIKKRILIIDDDQKLCRLLSVFLETRGFVLEHAYNGSEGLRAMEKTRPDLILLDVMMPGKNGFEVLREIRKRAQVPVMMLTARGQTTDRVTGLDLGADDYMAKPFDPVEIEARINAILRRSGEAAANPLDKEPQGTRRSRIRFARFTLDLQKKILAQENSTVELTQAEFNLLEYLALNPDQVISRDQISEYLKGDEFDPSQRGIDILVSRLRKKIGDDPKKPDRIKTIHGRGYMFISDRNNRDN